VAQNDGWTFEWRRRLFEWENVLLEDLKTHLQSFALQQENSDTWEWKQGNLETYSVAIAYIILIEHHCQNMNLHQISIIDGKLWKSNVLS